MRSNEPKNSKIIASPSLNPATPFFSKKGQVSGEKPSEAELFFSPHSVQAKLEIGKPNDVYEQQAEAVASQVVTKINNPTPALHAKNNPLDAIHRKPDMEGEQEIIQRSGGGLPVASEDFSSKFNAAKGGGQPLPADINQSMGSAMGADFSRVRIHTDTASTNLSRSIHAQAFTHGNDVYFNEGKYNPSSPEGQHLIAHELTHTVQQTGGVRRKIVQRNLDIAMMPYQTIQPGMGTWGLPARNIGEVISRKEGDDAKLKKVKASGHSTGSNFDTKVDVPNPVPSNGDMLVTMRLNVNFQNTDLKFIKKNILDTDKANLKQWEAAIAKIQKEAPEKLKWSEPEKEKVRKDYRQNIDDVWSSESSKLTFQLNDPFYEKYNVRNNFKLEFTKKKPHHQFTVVKMVDGPMLRSYMGGDIGGFHDSRTFGGTQDNGKVHDMHAEQLGNFANNSVAMTPEISAQIDAMVGKINKIKNQHKTDKPVPVWNLTLIGRASSTGDKAQNLVLSQGRADTVKGEVSGKVGADVSITAETDAMGNSKTKADAKFRRVEAIFKNTNGTPLKQTVMAHETGHLFGYGDEYGDVQTGGNVLPKFAGDEANDTSKAIRDAGMGEDVVNDHRIANNSDSIMNAGNVVGVGHYSLFLTQLKKISTDAKTSKKVNWEVIKG